jgi:hypothetical protein
LFSADGAVGGFGARASLAYLMGIISREAHTDLQTFAKIRNSFAHYTEHDTFETESIKARCGNFKLIDSHVERADTPYETMSGGKIITDLDAALHTPKGRFIATAKLFCAAFANFLLEEDDPSDDVPKVKPPLI